MTFQNARIEAAPRKSGDGMISAKLFNQRLGLKGILIERIDRREVLALSESLTPDVGETITILLPTGTELCGVVSWTGAPRFCISLDPEARAGEAG